jgi:hypothetical protein
LRDKEEGQGRERRKENAQNRITWIVIMIALFGKQSMTRLGEQAKAIQSRLP